ncbi:MAG TPA: maleylpyruvate isomerase family mycothiol-dependent enzyme [Chloroflexota bacterium]|jgi:uncharacterized protein (TIGR03083 family)|nr:maleylpyruvate isomerase family mycothiol-dependent enzyme [Chloroflexota bacterium]
MEVGQEFANSGYFRLLTFSLAGGGMNKHEYLDIFSSNRAAILAAAELGLDAPVAGCPGWDVGALVAHMGGVYTFWGKWVRDRPRGWSDEAQSALTAERESELPGFGEWRAANFPSAGRPAGIVEFARSTGDRLEAELRKLAPSEPVWSFFKPNQTAGFVQRRICQETTIHRWDAESAHGIGRPIPPELARDGVDEYLTMIIQLGFDDEGKRSTGFSGERFCFQEVDGDMSWLVTFSRDGIQSSSGSGSADVTVSGSASDLLLFMMGRLPVDSLAVEGDAMLATRWNELAGSF